MPRNLEGLRSELAGIVGEELANSLVWAGRRRGEYDLNMQLLLNDGLEQVPNDKKLEALDLIDAWLTEQQKSDADG